MNQKPRITRKIYSLLTLAAFACTQAQTPGQTPGQTPNPIPAKNAILRELTAGRQSMADKQYVLAERHFREALRLEPDSVPVRVSLADAELALHHYDAAELDYRRVVASAPQMWVAHKNLVIIEAALGRWDEFERERALLRAARQRGAGGISARESDVIDSFDAVGRHWIVREYFEPVGRSQARYNFESFAPDGRIREYISLEFEQAAKAALPAGGAVSIGDATPTPRSDDRYALNWYTTKAHGTVHVYPPGEPEYEHVRADVLHWLRAGATTR